MKYAFIQNHRQQFNLKALCRLLEVSRSSYYEWLQHQQRLPQRQQRQTAFDQAVAQLFANIFANSKGCNGARRLQRQLRAMTLDIAGCFSLVQWRTPLTASATGIGLYLQS